MKNLRHVKFRRNEKGEMPIGPILIIALVVLPLVFVLISFRNTANTELSEQATEVFGKGDDPTEITK